MGNNRFSLIKFLEKENADIVNLQEIPGGLNSDIYYNFSFRDHLMKKLKYEYSFYSETLESKVLGKRITYGLLILSRYPITYKKSLLIAGRINRRSLLTISDYNTRLLQHARIKVGKIVINCLNYHGYFIWGTKMGNSITESHCRHILKYMGSIDQKEKIILSGDFNLAPWTRSLGIIGKHYSNLDLRYKVKTTRNELVGITDPVDNIFVNDQVRVRSLKVPHVYVSDHLPLVMKFN